jgi:ElaB/YqjD/DUF883 family membrane-anchored ribosome-binding protein
MTEKKTLATELAAVMAEVGYVQKDARNDHFKYKYASADAVLTKVREACSKRGIAVVRTGAEVVSYENQIAVVRLTQTYRFGGEEATFTGLGSGKDSGDKAVMKANTAALKYLLSLAFNISWGDDPEADSKTDAPSEPKKRPSARRKQAPKSEPKADGKPEMSLFERLSGMISTARGSSDLDEVRDDMLRSKADLSAEEFKTLRGRVIEARKALAKGEKQ